MKKIVVVIALFALAACDIRDFLPIPSVSVVQPQDGAMVTNPVYLELEAKHWAIEPPVVRRDGAGYFVIVLEGGCVPEGRLVPFEVAYVHLQQGQRNVWLDLAPGTYEVCLQVADGNHRALPLTHEVTFEVVD